MKAVSRPLGNSIALRTHSVSRETLIRLRIYEDLLRRWSKMMNLVAPSTMNAIWPRHFADSLQLLDHSSGAKVWVDIGSGAGFPGLPIAIALAEIESAAVHLIESDTRKCAFLREVIRATGAPAFVHARRAEDVLGDLEGVEIVCARAVAPLDALVSLSRPLLRMGATGLFLKGRDYRSELTRLGQDDTFRIDVAPSLTDPAAAVIIVRDIGARGSPM